MTAIVPGAPREAISRGSGPVISLAVTASVGTTEVLDVRDVAFATWSVPSGSSLTSLAVYHAPALAAETDDAAATEFVRMQDPPGTDLSVAVAAGKGGKLPEVLLGCRFVKLVGNASGTVTVATTG